MIPCYPCITVFNQSVVWLNLSEANIHLSLFVVTQMPKVSGFFFRSIVPPSLESVSVFRFTRLYMSSIPCPYISQYYLQVVCTHSWVRISH